MKRFLRNAYEWLSDRSAPSRGWKLLMLWLAIAGTVGLGLWCIEEATQSLSMAVWLSLKCDEFAMTDKTLDVYERVRQVGHWGNWTVGLSNPLTFPAYKTYFDKACPQYLEVARATVQNGKALAEAGKRGPLAGYIPTVKPKAKTAEGVAQKRNASRDELVDVSLTPLGETDKSWRFEVDGKVVYLPKSQCLKVSDNSFKVPRWLVSMKKLTELAAK